MKNTKFILKLALILFIIAFACSLLLIVCNNLTKDRIAELQLKTEAQAQTDVLPAAESFEDTDTKIFDDEKISKCAVAKDENGKIAGYCFNVQPSGFGGKISLTVGIDTDGKVSGVKITDMSETPGLGAKAKDENWLKQFVGKKDITVVKTGNAKDNEINAISGATITSKAVTEGVNAASKAAEILMKEGK